MNYKATILVNAELDKDVKYAFEGPLHDIANIIYIKNIPTDEELKHWKEIVDILVIGKINSMFKFEDIKRLNNLKLIQLFSAGADYLPFEQIPSNVLIACNAGGFSQPIAEYVLTMICGFYKNIVLNHNDLAKGIFSHKRQGRSIMNLRIGVIGFGGIGKVTARLLKNSINASIYAINRDGKKTEDGFYDYIGSMHQLDFVLSQVDVAILCLPLNLKTEGIINSRRLALMKENALLINVARGGLIVQDDLYHHLEKNHSFGAVLDAWWVEPFFNGEFKLNHPFLKLPNLIGSPHNSYNNLSYFVHARKMVAENIKGYLIGKKIHGILNRAEYIKQTEQ